MNIGGSCAVAETGKTIAIPATAVEVNVTNIVSPYSIRIYEVENYAAELDTLGKKLLRFMQKGKLERNNAEVEPQPQQRVIVHNRLNQNVDLPAWWCRGIIGCLNAETSMYDVFLPDYGNSIELSRNDFTILPNDSINDDYLTSTIGIYNIVPITVKNNVQAERSTTAFITNEWSSIAIQFTKELIIASRSMYFDHVASDEHGRKYGELYLIADDEIISLSKILVFNQFAIYLEGDLLNLIEDAEYDTKRKPEMVDGHITIHFSNWNTYNIGENQEHDISTRNENNATGITKGIKKCSTIPAYAFQRKSVLNAYEEQDHQRMLICNDNKCKRLDAVANAKFPAKVHMALNSLHITRLKQIQSYIWPAITKGLNIVAVSPPRSGKTFGYIAPIVSSIATCNEIPKGTKPLALILCSSSSDVFNAYSLCIELLKDYPKIGIVAAFNGKPERSLVAEMYNGCQILISTPPFLARFMSRNKKLLNFEKLAHLILDEADVIFEKYFSSVAELFGKYKVIRNRERQILGARLLQIIAVSRHWTIHLKKLAASMDNPYICIGSYMEAAVYASVRALLYGVHTQGKNEKTLELLGDYHPMFKTMIICSTTEEATDLNEFLLSHSKKTLLAHGKMIFNELQGVKEYWNMSVSGKYPILICTDEVLSDLGITNVQWLIHYSITLISKSHFYFRFSTLMDTYLNDKSDKEKSNCKVVIIADESNDVQIQGVVGIMQRLGAKIPSHLVKLVESVSVTLDTKKKDYPICDNVKLLGFCPRKVSCAYRHCILRDVDRPMTNIEIGDSVKLIVTYIHNATHYSARVTELVKSRTMEKINFSFQEYTQLYLKMQEYYADPNNRRINRMVNVGDICALEESIESFKRVQVLCVMGKDRSDIPNLVKVRCIDDGNILEKIYISQLLEIPEELSKWPMHVVEVFLSGVAPYDNEFTWNYCANDMVHEWFKKYLEERTYVFGKVHLHLGNTIWIDQLEIRMKIIGYPDMISSSLKDELINEKHGVASEKHLADLYNLCRSSGITDINGCDVSVGDKEI